MAIDFSRLLTPAQRTRLARTRAENACLHALPDRWLAEALLRMARQIRAAHPDRPGNPRDCVYEPTFVWHVVPEVAKRLGATRLLPNEASDPRVSTLDGQALREPAGVCLQNVALDRWGRGDVLEREAPSPEEILCHSISNGNPLAFALDRLCPAPEEGADWHDWIARHMRESSRFRGLSPTPAWSPALQGRGPGRDKTRQAPRRGALRARAPTHPPKETPLR